MTMAHTSDRPKEFNSPNHLVREKSPYLLQHAYNPVEWYPWGDEAFEKADRENKPIFLSIGYSTCHWCHVMEKESFEDLQVAQLMNDAFVSIKVDREERPDLDHIYMAVCQIMTGNGGWPLTIVMTPQKEPFFSATYIPKESRFDRPGMVELIPKIKAVWDARRSEVLESAKSVTNALHHLERETSGKEMERPVLDKAYQELAKRFDETYGGFGQAPKFPTPHNFLFLLRYWKRTADPDALNMVEKTLQELRLGGVYDQLGFGFHRYSTDREWLVPHFEKMLYDQAMLSLAYMEAYQATGKDLYANTAREIFEYVLRDMRSPEGGFYSAEDADSEGVEGKFYVWTEEELRRILSPEEADLIIKVFNVQKGGNFKEEATGRNTGSNILYLGKTLREIAESLHISLPELEQGMESARAKLFEKRERRIHPHKDDKVLADWNGLMIAALAQGARVLGSATYAGAASAAAEFVLKRLRTPEGRLLHRYRDGEAGIPAHLDDYAFLIWGLTQLYEATFQIPYLKTALELNEDMLKHFWDDRDGGFFFTPDDGEHLLIRKKAIYDGALPSGNAVALLNLLRLARFTGRPDLDKKAAQTGAAFSKPIEDFPSGYTQFLTALDFAIGPSYEVVVVGPPSAPDTEEMLKVLSTRFIPNKVVLLRPSEEPSPDITRLAPFTAHHRPVDGKATAYVCVQNACKMPTADVTEMLALLQQ
jgi:uncharacterized protein YyaL (SSP411 family)